MPIQVWFDGDIAILSNFGRSINDPRYFDTGQEVRDLLAQGYRSFVVELSGADHPGSPLLSLLMTLTRQVRKERGEIVLAGRSRDMERCLAEMRMDEFWDVFRSVEEATQHLARRPGPGRDEDS
jgi:anti-anti-sigma regulatory factor